MEAKVIECEIDNLSGLRDVMGLFTMVGSTVVSGMERAKGIHTSSQIDRSADESDLLASLAHERPACLFSATADCNPNKLVKRNKGFGPNCDTYLAYDGSRVAYKSTIEDRIRDAVVTLRADFDMTRKGDRLKDCLLE